MSKAPSSRIKEAAQRRVLDDASRQRRARKALENLEQDNNCDDPHADLVMSKKALSLFQEDEDHGQRKTKRKARTMEYYKLRFRKNLAQLLEEEAGEQEGAVPYLAAQLPESKIPPRRLCAVCGFPRFQWHHFTLQEANTMIDHSSALTPAPPVVLAIVVSVVWRLMKTQGTNGSFF